jgi:hypothetical protein
MECIGLTMWDALQYFVGLATCMPDQAPKQVQTKYVDGEKDLTPKLPALLVCTLKLGSHVFLSLIRSFLLNSGVEMMGSNGGGRTPASSVSSALNVAVPQSDETKLAENCFLQSSFGLQSPLESVSPSTSGPIVRLSDLRLIAPACSRYR